MHDAARKGEDPLDQLLATAIRAARIGGEIVGRYFRDATLEVRAKGDNDFVTGADHESEAAILAEIRRCHPHHRILAEEGGASAGIGTGDGGGGSRPGGGSGGGDSGRAAAAGNTEGDVEWLVDPLDGTNNFVQGLPVYCVSVACRRGDTVLAGAVHDPEGDNLFTAVRGGGAMWNGRPMRVSAHPGLAGSFLATGYPWRAISTLDVYLGIFREVFIQSKAIRRCGAAALDLAYTAAGVYDGFFEFRLSPWDIGAGVLLVEEAGGRVTDVDGGRRYFAGGNVVAGGAAVHEELLAVARRHASEAAIDRLMARETPR